MKTIVIIDQVSKEVKTKISKLGYDALIKKYNSGLFETDEEITAARFYMTKRGVNEFIFAEADKLFYSEYLNNLQPTTTTTTFGRHCSEMSQEEIAAAEARLDKVKAENKQIAEQLTPTQQQIVDKVKKGGKITIELQAGKAETAVSQVGESIKVVKEKIQAEPIMKLTEQEFKLFESIKQQIVEQSKHDVEHHNKLSLDIFTKQFESLREFKGILGSLMKKGIVSYIDDQLTIEKIGFQMCNGQLLYKQKSKHEQNFFKKTRVTVEVDGKNLEKSAYVRMLLRKNNHISCSELNDELTTVGFSKLYHSELQRCKNQLGIVTDKNKY